VCKYVLYFCHRVSTQLQLTNISYHLHCLGARRVACNKLHTEDSHTLPATVQNLVSWKACPRGIVHPWPRFSQCTFFFLSNSLLPVVCYLYRPSVTVHSVPHNYVLIGELVFLCSFLITGTFTCPIREISAILSFPFIN